MAVPTEPGIPEIPEVIAAPKRRWAMQWVWLLPIVAAVIGGWLAVRAVLSGGPTVTLQFKTAEGLEAGKTRIKYKEVDLGVVKDITLDKDRSGVLVKADLSKAAEELLVEDTRFWVVRARIAGGTVSGIGTLLSGSYIGLDPGKSQVSRREFVGLETPPVITTGLPGKQYVLHAEDIGSLDVGSPVYYRRLEAGRVIAYELDAEGKGVIVRVFVNAPYDRYVTPTARFWHASGIDLALDASGLKINTESLTSVVVGGVAFQAPDPSPRQEPVAENAVYTLFADRSQAMKQPITHAERYALVFRQSVRGLAVGAPVDFQGLAVGEVKSIAPQFNLARNEFSVTVEIDFYPEQLFRSRSNAPIERQPSLAPLVERGLRAQLRSANLLTGQLFVALDFVAGARKVSMDATRSPPEVPTVPGAAQELQATIGSIARKVDSVPFERIGIELQRTLQVSATTLERIDRAIVPQARETIVEARKAMTETREALAEARKALASVERTLTDVEPLPLQASDTLTEIGRAARSLQTLTDYLERHPEAVIRGKRAHPP